MLAWTQMLALVGQARRWEPKWLRLRVFAVARRLASSGRSLRLRLAERWPWADDITAAIARLLGTPAGSQPQQPDDQEGANTKGP